MPRQLRIQYAGAMYHVMSRGDHREAGSGTLTVAGTVGQKTDPVSVTVSGTGLSSGAAAVYEDGSWARAGANPVSGANTYTAAATDGLSRTSQDTVSVNLPASVSFAYDANGNLLNDGRRYFEYDPENQLTAVTVSNAVKRVKSIRVDANEILKIVSRRFGSVAVRHTA